MTSFVLVSVFGVASVMGDSDECCVITDLISAYGTP